MADLPKRPTVEQKRHNIACLTELISELELWDPFEQPYGAEVTKLENAIDETLTAVFGYETAGYEQYKSAKHLERYPVFDADIPRWKFSLGGVYGPEIQASETAKRSAARAVSGRLESG